MPGKVHVYHDPVEDGADSRAVASKKRKKKSNGEKAQPKAKRKRAAVAPLDDVSNRATRQRTSKTKVVPVTSASNSSASSASSSEDTRAKVDAAVNAQALAQDLLQQVEAGKKKGGVLTRSERRRQQEQAKAAETAISRAAELAQRATEALSKEDNKAPGMQKAQKAADPPQPPKQVAQIAASASSSSASAAPVQPAVAPPLDPIDVADLGVATCCAEYARDIQEYHLSQEAKYAPSCRYLSTVNVDINQEMRAILVDWLVEVAEEYQLHQDTLYLCIHLLDRSLSKICVPRAKLQLLGCAAMLLASKYEEVYAPPVDDFVYISDNTYSREEVLEMERQVLHQLEFRLTSTTAWPFLTRFVKCVGSPDRERYMARYLSELALLDYGMLQYRPSMIAAAAMNLARQTIYHSEHNDSVDPWPETLQRQSGYTAADLADCVTELHGLHEKAGTSALQAVREKYSHDPKCWVGIEPPIPCAKLSFAGID